MRNIHAGWGIAMSGVLAAALIPAPVQAQCDFNLTRYNSSGAVSFGSVQSMTIFDDGRGDGPALIVGGDFDKIGGVPAWNVAKWSPASGWSAMGAEIYYVHELTVFNNELYAAALGNVWKWDGFRWATVGSDFPSPYSVQMVFVFDAGDGPALYASLKNNLYRLERGDWTVIARLNGTIASSTEFDDGNGPALYLGGNFTKINGAEAYGIVRWDGTTGSQAWTSVGQGVHGAVISLIVHDFDGAPALYAGGTFTHAGDLPAHYLAVWQGPAKGWAALQPIDTSPGARRVGGFVQWNDGNGLALYAVSSYISPDSGDSTDSLWKLETNGTWSGLGSTYLIPSSGISCLMPFGDGTTSGPSLYIGGRFSRIGTWSNWLYEYHLARRTPQPDSAFAPTPADPEALSGVTNALTTFDSGDGPKLYAGGQLVGLEDQPNMRTLVARLEGQSWTSIASSSSARTQALASFDDGGGPALYAAGTFTTIGGTNANRIAKWSGPAGGGWSPLGAGLNGPVYALCVHDDGGGPALFAAGQFTTAGGMPANNIAKWSGSARGWSQVATGVKNIAYALASFDDGSGQGAALYAGGVFTQAGEVPASHLAKWNGAAWSEVDGGVSGFVRALHVHHDQVGVPSLIVGGQFSQAGEIAARNIAQWHGPAGGWSTIGSIEAVGDLPTVYALTSFDDGSGPGIIASGLHASFRGARWNGIEWATFGTSTLVDATTSDSVNVYHTFEGALYSGSNNSLAKWSVTGDALAISAQSLSGSFQPDTTVQFGVTVVHGGAVVYQWRRNGLEVENGPFIEGAKRDRLWIFNINGSFEGTYDVLVRNDCETIASDSIEVDVIGTCLGDVTLDNVTNVNDLLAVTNAWGSCPPGNAACPADLDHDRAVDVADMSAVLNAWGPCP